MIGLALVLGLSTAWATTLVEATGGIVGRGMRPLADAELGTELVELQRWDAAADAWAARADRASTDEERRQALLWKLVSEVRDEEATAARKTILEILNTGEPAPEALLLAAWTLAHGGDAAGAVRIARLYPRHRPDAVGAAVLEMRAHTMSGRHRKAQRVARAAIRGGRTDAWFWVELGFEAHITGRESAWPLLQRAMASSDAGAHHYRVSAYVLGRQGALDAAARVLVEGLARWPDQSRVFSPMAAELIADPAGRAALERAVQEAPASQGGPERLLAGALVGVGEPQAAGEAYGAAIAAGAREADLYGLQAQAFEGAGALDRAWTVLREGVRVHPSDGNLLLGLFGVSERLSAPERVLEAAALCDQAGLVDPQISSAAYEAARDLDRPGVALRWADTAARLTPMDPRVQAMRALALSGLGRSEEALAAYERAQVQAPSDPTILNNFAWFLLAPGTTAKADPQRARRLAEAALAAAETRVPAFLDTLAAAHWALGDATEAARLQREAVGLDPSNSALQGRLNTYLDGLK